MVTQGEESDSPPRAGSQAFLMDLMFELTWQGEQKVGGHARQKKQHKQEWWGGLEGGACVTGC